ncbi:MAG TPA: PfkB family carbohydrate kinase, partial [Trichocoleus sp.]
MGRGLFVGLITLDCIYKVDQVPGSDDKIVAEDCLLVAGGPATNAAVAFRYLGNQATVLGGLGSHSVTSLIRSDLQAQGVEIQDLLPER